MTTTLAGTLRDALAEALAPLASAGTPAGFRTMVASFGHTSTVADNAALRTAIAQASTLADEIARLDDATLASLDGVQRVLGVAARALDAVRAVEAALTDPALAALAKGLGQQIVSRLAALYLRAEHQQLHRVLSLLTLVEPAETATRQPLTLSGTGAIVRMPWADDTFHLDRLATLIGQPATMLRAAYLPNALATAADSYVAADRLFPLLGMLAESIGVPSRRDLFPLDPPGLVGDDSAAVPGDHVAADRDPDPTIDPVVDPNAARVRHLPRFAMTLAGAAGAPSPLGVEIVLSSPEHVGHVAGATVSVTSAANWTETRGAWTLTFQSSGQLSACVVGPNGVALAAGGPSTGGTARFSVARAPQGAPAVVIGNPTGTRLEIGALRFGADLALSPAHASIGLSADIDRATIVVMPGDGDSFLAEVLPADGLRSTLDLGLTLSSDGGLKLRGQAGLTSDVPIGLSLGPVTLSSAHLALLADPSGTVRAEASASLGASIGPVRVQIDRVGLAATLGFPQGGGNVGVADLAFGFKPPSGVGLSIDVAGVATGSGFLFHDPAQGLYAGALQLSLHEQLTVTAVGLIATRLPDGSPGYSMLILITAEDFRPIPLGLGFTLQAIGGLLGVHRTFDAGALRDGLRNDTLGTLLFPKAPAANAAALLRALTTAFPARRGSYLLGLMARIGWGTPTLVQFDLALILELGSRTRLLALGRVTVLLPSPDNDLIRLQLDAVGVLDFDAETIALDATLVDSRLVHKFAISGSGAFRGGWGDAGPGKGFLLSVGGFNPRFAPPTGVPTLDRVTLALCAGKNPQLLCEAYFAVTSNTLQFGARAHLYAEAAGFSLVGDLGFDVLYTRNPIHFLIDFHASVQLKRGSRNLLTVSVAGTLEGPRPLHLCGKATFSIFWIDFSVHFDATLVSGEQPPRPPAVDVQAALVQALLAPQSWHTDGAATGTHGVALRPLPPGAPGAPLVLDPLGHLTVTQDVVPLATARDIDVFGGAPVTGARRFTVTATLAGGGPGALVTTPVTAAFAPAQFFAMPDADKLVAPSFEAMTAGLQLGTATVDYAHQAPDLVPAPLTYQSITLDALPPAAAPLPAPTSYTMPAAQLATHAATGAAGRAPARRIGRSRFQRPGAPVVQIAAPAWTIVALGDAPKPVIDPSVQTWAEHQGVLARLNRGGARYQLVSAYEPVAL